MSALFDPGREGFLDGSIQWNATPTHKISLLRGYTFSAAHKFVSEVTGAGGSLVATQTLSGKLAASGVADASDVTFPTVAAGDPITALIIYQASATSGGADLAASSQRLIAFIDDAANLPITPNGGNIDVVFDSGPNKIFKL
ncbi:hypothetical protein [Pseudonocardia parietis]|uniref:Uncharacterized protein n=1 Tax=Pseudonocardia parietis TaxID=570936 RepID=A0ABS4W1Y8_9PSEU|nr:hypothetical protein [Pseudonocardia parietis]MBP2370215.1 hypothetical protein [Pseudonocardia parietis]